MLSGVAGLRLDYAVPMGRCYPATTLEYSYDFTGGSRASIGYADIGGPLPFGPTLDTLSQGYAVAEPGDPAHFDNGLLLGFDYDLLMGLDGDTQQHRVGVHIGADF